MFMTGIYHTQSSSDPCLAFQGLNDNKELFLQPLWGWCLHSSLISTPVTSPVQRCFVPKGKTTLQSSILHRWGSWVPSASGNHLIKASFASAALKWQSSGLSNCSRFKLLFREEIPTAPSSSHLLKWSSWEVNRAIHSIKECLRSWPGILAGSWRIHFPPQINLQCKLVPNPQLIKSAENYQLLEPSDFYHFGSTLVVQKPSLKTPQQGIGLQQAKVLMNWYQLPQLQAKPWALLSPFTSECGERLAERTLCRSQKCT